MPGRRLQRDIARSRLTRQQEDCVPTTQINATNLTDIDRPTCRACGSRMWLSRVSPPVDGREWRTFECPVCEVSTAPPAERGSGASTPI